MSDSIHKIAVISDTHGLLRPEVSEILRPCERILHGGDINRQEILDQLNEIAKVIAVRGNNDKDWATSIPAEACFEIYGKKIYMIHNRKHLSAKAEHADIIIYGHSHKYEEVIRDGKLWLNPGSCGPRRFRLPVTMALLEFDTVSGTVNVRKVDLSSEPTENTIQDISSVDGKKLITALIREMENGKSIEYMIKKHNIGRELAEQICQLYATHPGIDAQGVLDKMDILGL